MDTQRLLLTVRTARYLRPAQLLHRVRLRTQRQVVRRAPGLVASALRRPRPAGAGWPVDFSPVDARTAVPYDPQGLDAGRLTLLGHTRQVDDWRSTDPPQLWRYHLHYWDWAWGLAQHPDRLRARADFRRLFTRWQEQTMFGRWDEWSPYVVALRAWSWCGQYDSLVRGADFDDDFVDLLGLHAAYLRAHLELDVGGNHLLKDLKALVGLAVFLSDDRLLARTLRPLRQEVARQVLPDGGHVERAPAYHCQVLADLADLDGLLGARSPAWLAEAVLRMRTFLGLVLLPDGSVPLLNDGFPVPASMVAALQPGPPAPDGLTLLPHFGVAVLRRGPWHLLADVGLPCPDDLPAHAQADTLGFLLHHGSRRLVGEAGTSTYAPGPLRDHERGTAAHSTVQVDGLDSTEVWGAFRAARRARPTVLRAEDTGGALVLQAEHDGYRRLPGRPVHRRTWTVDAERVRVVDEVLGEGEHELVARLHGTAPAVVEVSTGVLREVPTEHADGWEQRRQATVLEHRTHARLPWRFEVTLRDGESA